MGLALGLILSAAIGLSLGLVGGGGSIITVPILVYALGIPPHRAIGMSLAVVGSTALIGAMLHHRQGLGLVEDGQRLRGERDPERVPRLEADAPGVAAGPDAPLRRDHARGGDPDAGPPAPRDEKPHVPSPPREALAGFGVGFMTGFLGVGGGFLIVPALHVFGGLPMKAAIGTSLFVIGINCAAGLIGHMTSGAVRLAMTALVTGLAVTGALAGTALSDRFHPKGLRRLFAWLVLAVAAYLISRNYNALFQ